MAEGLKQNETRGRTCHVRADVAICSARRPLDLSELSMELRVLMADNDITGCLLGQVLCVVELYDCKPTDRPKLDVGPVEALCGDYRPGRYAWLTRNRRPLRKPVPVVGHQGFFFLPADVETKVREQI